MTTKSKKNEKKNYPSELELKYLKHIIMLDVVLKKFPVYILSPQQEGNYFDCYCRTMLLIVDGYSEIGAHMCATCSELTC